MTPPSLLDQLAVRLLRLFLPHHEVRSYLSEVDEAVEARAGAGRRGRRSAVLLRLLAGLFIERVRTSLTIPRKTMSAPIQGRLHGAGPMRMDALAQEARQAVRRLRRAPGFSLAVIVTLALGIGANAAMFDVVDRLMFRPLARLHDPGSVHRIYWQWQQRGSTVTSLSTQYARYLDLTRGSTSFSRIAAFAELDLPVGETDAIREVPVAAVSASFFDLFDAPPALGRYFGADEDVPALGMEVAILSNGFWRSEYGGDDVVGRRLRVGNMRPVIIGVAPPGLEGVNRPQAPAVYVPITAYASSTGTDDAKTYATTYHWGWVHVLAQRRPGVSVEQAEVDASQVFRRSWRVAQGQDPQVPSLEAGQPHATVSAVRPGAGPDPALEARTAMWVLIVAGLVFLIACANVANLLLMRALRRRRAAAVRRALGAGRARLALGPLLEGVLLALASGAAALLTARVLGRVAGKLLVDAQPSAPSLMPNPRTLAVAIVLALLAGLLVSVLSSLTSSRGSVVGDLRAGARDGGTRGGRSRATLLVVQSALSVVLLVGAALFVHSLGAVRGMAMGFDPERVVRIERVIAPGSFDSDVQTSLRRTLLATAQAMPLVEAAAWVSSAPFVSTSSTGLYVEGIDSVGALGTFTYQATTPDYFRTMGTRILRGRGIESSDDAGGRFVAVVSESMARVLWPEGDALGRCLRMRTSDAPCRTVVGIAEDIVQRTLTQEQRYQYYLPIEQYDRTWGNGLLVKLRGDERSNAETVRQALQALVPGDSYLRVRSMEDIVQRERRSWRLGATMFAAFGLLALLVAAVGLYAAIGYDVAQRMHELGIRVALGAGGASILSLVMGRSVGCAAAGSALGLLLALASRAWIQPLLFGTSVTDPRVYAGVATLMLAVALMAAVLPASGAVRADPVKAIRSD